MGEASPHLDASGKEWDFLETNPLRQMLHPRDDVQIRCAGLPKRPRASSGLFPVLQLELNYVDALRVSVKNGEDFTISASAWEFLSLTDSSVTSIVNAFKGCVPAREKLSDLRFSNHTKALQKQVGGVSGKTRVSAKQRADKYKKAVEAEMESMFTCIFDLLNSEQRNTLATHWGAGMASGDVDQCMTDWRMRIVRRN